MIEKILRAAADGDATLGFCLDAADEIERLRSIAFGAEEYAQTVRKATIEQCVREIERWEHADETLSYLDLIDRIRRMLHDTL